MRNLPSILARPAARAIIVATLSSVVLCSLAANRTDRGEPDEAAWLFSTVYARLFFSGHLPLCMKFRATTMLNIHAASAMAAKASLYWFDSTEIPPDLILWKARSSTEQSIAGKGSRS